MMSAVHCLVCCDHTHSMCNKKDLLAVPPARDARDAHAAAAATAFNLITSDLLALHSFYCPDFAAPPTLLSPTVLELAQHGVPAA